MYILHLSPICWWRTITNKLPNNSHAVIPHCTSLCGSQWMVHPWSHYGVQVETDILSNPYHLSVEKKSNIVTWQHTPEKKHYQFTSWNRRNTFLPLGLGLEHCNLYECQGCIVNHQELVFMLYCRVFNSLLWPFMGATLHCTGITYSSGYSLHIASQKGVACKVGTDGKDS